VNNEPPNPYSPVGASPDLQDGASLEAMLAADGQRGFEEHLKGPSIPQLRRAGLDEVSPASQWHVPGAREGCWIIGTGANAVVLSERFEGTPYYWRWLFDEKQTVPGEKKPKLIATWSCEPKDATYPRGRGYSRSGNGNLLSERVVIDLLYGGPDGPTPCRLTLFGKDNRKIAETFRQKLLAKYIRGADGRPKPAPLYATRIAITTNEREEERGDNRGNPIKVTVWAPVFDFLGVYPNAAGPDRETVLLGRDLCIGQETVKYPDPNTSDVVPRLRVVNGPSLEEPDFGEVPSGTQATPARPRPTPTARSKGAVAPAKWKGPLGG
jgi:hypothetical protein